MSSKHTRLWNRLPERQRKALEQTGFALIGRNDLAGVETRLATKLDTEKDRDKVRYLQQTGAMIVPVSSTGYVLTTRLGYIQLHRPGGVTLLPGSKPDLVNSGLGVGESNHIGYAWSHSVLDTFLAGNEEHDLGQPSDGQPSVLRRLDVGRRNAEAGRFAISGVRQLTRQTKRVVFDTGGLQIEQDGCFAHHTLPHIVNVEAKSFDVETIHPRQIAFAHWDVAARAPGMSITSVLLCANRTGRNLSRHNSFGDYNLYHISAGKRRDLAEFTCGRAWRYVIDTSGLVHAATDITALPPFLDSVAVWQAGNLAKTDSAARAALTKAEDEPRIVPALLAACDATSTRKQTDNAIAAVLRTHPLADFLALHGREVTAATLTVQARGRNRDIDASEALRNVDTFAHLARL